jgi:type VI secretion system secreted protein VgrG
MSDSGSSPLENASDDADQNMSPAPAGSPTQSCGSAPTPNILVSPDKTHWIAIELVDELGKHVPYEDYRITLPDGTIIEGSLDRGGRAKITGIDSGTCKISFPNRDEADWKPRG